MAPTFGRIPIIVVVKTEKSQFDIPFNLSKIRKPLPSGKKRRCKKRAIFARCVAQFSACSTDTHSSETDFIACESVALTSIYLSTFDRHSESEAIGSYDRRNAKERPKNFRARITIHEEETRTRSAENAAQVVLLTCGECAENEKPMRICTH